MFEFCNEAVHIMQQLTSSQANLSMMNYRKFNDCIVQILLTIAEHKISFSVVINFFQIGLLFDFACSFSTGSYNHVSYKLWCTCYDIIHIQVFNKMDILLQIMAAMFQHRWHMKMGYWSIVTPYQKLKLLIINSQCISNAGRVCAQRELVFKVLFQTQLWQKLRAKLQHVHKCNKSYERNYYSQSCRSMTLAITSLGGLLGHRKSRILTPTIFGKVELLWPEFSLCVWSFWVAYWALAL